MYRRIIVAGAIIGLLGILLFQSVSGFIGRNTFDPDATLHRNGRMMWVTAQITCTQGEQLSVEVRVSQEQGELEDQVGALAEGRANTICESDDPLDEETFQEVTILATARGRERFIEGPAVATGLAITRERGQVTGVRQWQPEDGIVLEH